MIGYPALKKVNIKTVIIDDELLARRRIGQLLADEPEFQVVNESANVSDGITACLAGEIDLVFLDIQLPDGSGFDVLRQLPEEHLPAVIFVTAFDQHTIEAFDFHAVDYLLKPFSEERFRQSTSRVRQRLNHGGRYANNTQVKGLLDHIKSDQEFVTRLIVNHRERLIVVPIKEVDWITAFGNYLRVHSKEKTYLLRGTINRMEERLDPEQF